MKFLGRNNKLSNFLLNCIGTQWNSSRKLGSSAIKPVTLSYIAFGEKEDGVHPLLILHGLMGSKQNWNSLAKAMSSRFNRQVVCVDARNHGESEHSPEMTYHHMAADVESLQTSERLAPSVVIGHSMGGRTAMLMALEKPALVSKLVVVDISPVRDSPSLHSMERYFEVLETLEVPSGIAMSAARKLVDKRLSHTVKDPSVRQFLLTNLVEKPDGSFTWRVNLNALKSNFTKHIARFPTVSPNAKYEGSTLFIAGRHSDYIKPVDEEKILEFFPKATIVYIDGAGHWVHAEKPDKFLHVLSSFL